MIEHLSRDLQVFLDAWGDAVGWHRLKEFLDGLYANPNSLDDPDPVEEAADMRQEMQRLYSGNDLKEMLRELCGKRDAVEEYVDAQL